MEQKEVVTRKTLVRRAKAEERASDTRRKGKGEYLPTAYICNYVSMTLSEGRGPTREEGMANYREVLQMSAGGMHADLLEQA